MYIVAIQGIKGGVGTTTVTANLATSLRIIERNVVAIDLCPQNMLRLHLGMDYDNYNGHAKATFEGKHWASAGYCHQYDAKFLPFGQINDYATLNRQWESRLSDSNVIGDMLSELDFPDDTIVLLDCPPFPCQAGYQAFKAAELLITVVQPDGCCYPMMNQHKEEVAQSQQTMVRYLINRYSPSMMLERDMHDIIKLDMGEKVIPVSIHRDESLREAFAFKQTVAECARDSQAAYDFNILAMWVATAQQNHVQDASAIDPDIEALFNL